MKKDYVYIIIIGVLVAAVGFLTINNKNKDNSNSTNNNNGANSSNVSSPSTDKNNDTNQGTNNAVEKVRYYQYYNEINIGDEEKAWKSREIELNSDSTARWYYGGSNSGGAEYTGTYTENDKNIIMTLNLKTDDGKCDDKVSMNACKLTLTLTKTGNKLEEIIDLEDANETETVTYSKVEKNSLKLLD